MCVCGVASRAGSMYWAGTTLYYTHRDTETTNSQEDYKQQWVFIGV